MSRIDWTTVATFDTAAEAHLARLHLESHDIDCFIADENIVTTAWHYAIATGGSKLQVDRSDAERATALLATRFDASTESPIHLDDDDHCPRCNGSHIARDGFTARRVVGLAFLTATACTLHWILGGLLLSACVVVIVRSSGHRCTDCGHQWDLRRGFAVVPNAQVAPIRDDDRDDGTG